jgi:hypothetical protein
MVNDNNKPQLKYPITVQYERKEGHWVSGSCGTYSFQAKVYDTGSKYGIGKGRISKLNIWDTADRSRKNIIVNYDRGWDIQPSSNDEFTVYGAILTCLEQLPVEEAPQSVKS